MADAVSGRTLPFNPGAAASIAAPTVAIAGGTAALGGLASKVSGNGNGALIKGGKATATLALGVGYAGMFKDFLGDKPETVSGGAGRGAVATAALGATAVVGTMIWNPRAFTTRAAWGTTLIAAGLGITAGAGVGAFMGRGGEASEDTPAHEDGGACQV